MHARLCIHLLQLCREYSLNFLQEMQILDRLRHPNIMVLYAVVLPSPSILKATLTEQNSGDNQFAIRFLCEYCPASLFKKLYDDESALSEKQRLTYAKDFVSALVYLHSDRLRYVHRDLKSANLLLSEDNHLKV